MTRLVLQATQEMTASSGRAAQAFVDINWLYFSFLLFVFTCVLIFVVSLVTPEGDAREARRPHLRHGHARAGRASATSYGFWEIFHTGVILAIIAGDLHLLLVGRAYCEIPLADVRIVGRLRRHARIALDLVEQEFHRCVELRVLAIERRVRQVVDDDVGIDAVPARSAISPRAHTRRVSAAAAMPPIDEPVVASSARSRRPRCACRSPCRAPGGGSLRRTLRRPSRLLVHQHDHVAAECVLHVPVRLPGARLPVHPRLAQQLSRIQLSMLPPRLWRTSMMRPCRLKTG